MKVFTCTTFEGRWPVGTAAVVVAPDESEARRLLGMELAKRGLRLDRDDIFLEVPLHQTAAIVLRDGDY
jgi:hypothetical protein